MDREMELSCALADVQGILETLIEVGAIKPHMRPLVEKRIQKIYELLPPLRKGAA